MVGDDQLTPDFHIRVFLEGDRLMAQGTGQPALPPFAEARDRFILKPVDARLHFTRDETGRVSSGVRLQAGRELPLVRK
ncbi:MAG: hypothetical protein Q8O14_00440 [bacterium]|nr:hypothetical protein [bacterium]